MDGLKPFDSAGGLRCPCSSMSMGKSVGMLLTRGDSHKEQRFSLPGFKNVHRRHCQSPDAEATAASVLAFGADFPVLGVDFLFWGTFSSVEEPLKSLSPFCRESGPLVCLAGCEEEEEEEEALGVFLNDDTDCVVPQARHSRSESLLSRVH